MPRTKLEYTRLGSPTTSMRSKRFRISSQMIRNCISASRMPTQRWMPNPNDRWLRGRARSMMKSSAFSITSSSRLPETYHITTLSPFLICLPPSSVSLSAVRRMCASGVCQRIISGTMRVDQRRIVAQLLVLVGVFVERQHRPRHRVARRVVAADDQQDEVAEEVVAGPCAAWRRCAPASR